MSETDEEDVWKVLNGCNTCINTSVCDGLGNCVLLSIDSEMPENNKSKKRLISKIRTFGNGDPKQLASYKKQMGKVSEPVVKEYEPEIRLTLIEKMFIESLKKKR